MTFTRSLVPTAAIAVALWQVSAAQLLGLTPWRGGGFGMFSTINAPGSRYLAIEAADSSAIEYQVVLPSKQFAGALSPQVIGRALAFPTESRLEGIGRAILSAETRTLPLPTAGAVTASNYSEFLEPLKAAYRPIEVVGTQRSQSSQAPRVRSVQVAVLRLHFDLRSMKVSLKRVRRASVESQVR